MFLCNHQKDNQMKRYKFDGHVLLFFSQSGYQKIEKHMMDR